MAVLLAGCSPVLATRPMGQHPTKLDPAEWQGLWVSGTQTMMIEVADAAGGILRISVLEENGTPSRETHAVFLRDCCSTTFASYCPADAGDSFRWGPIALSGDDLMVWVPDAKKFGAFVNERKLKGRIETDGSVHLDELPMEEMHLLASGALGVPYHWDTPTVFHRVK